MRWKEKERLHIDCLLQMIGEEMRIITYQNERERERERERSWNLRDDKYTKKVQSSTLVRSRE